MIDRRVGIGRSATVALALLVPGLLVPGLSAGIAAAAEIAPHRALYTMSLSRTSGDASVTGASGTMAYQWGESCSGWTIEQNYRLKMDYTESGDVNIASNYVTWEAKDGLRYRFNQKETRDGAEEDGIRGAAQLDGAGKGGAADFEQPPGKSFKLAPGVTFPSAHTIFLIDQAKAGTNFISKHVFDGAAVEGAVLVSAVIGPKVEPDAEAAKKSPLLNRPGWRVRLAFFPADPKADQPDYELGMLLLDNGVSRDMVIDYGDYAIRAKLDDIEPLPKPKC
ncbi:MAG TPA: cell envelope integrity EipB family protein [Stellaceae bacterium]|nr:cell envelope integrity EipB family protein [Stellaceae bacterium]